MFGRTTAELQESIQRTSARHYDRRKGRHRTEGLPGSLSFAEALPLITALPVDSNDEVDLQDEETGALLIIAGWND